MKDSSRGKNTEEERKVSGQLSVVSEFPIFLSPDINAINLSTCYRVNSLTDQLIPSTNLNRLLLVLRLYQSMPFQHVIICSAYFG